MLAEAIRWLLIRYRDRRGGEPVIGVAVYVPRTQDLLLRFREDTDYIQEDDLEVLACIGEDLHKQAAERGGLWTFQWMSDTFSNTVFVEGPYDHPLSDGHAVLEALSLTYGLPT